MGTQTAGMPGSGRPIRQENRDGGPWREPPRGGGWLRQLSNGCFVAALTILVLEHFGTPVAFVSAMVLLALLLVLGLSMEVPARLFRPLCRALASAAVFAAFCRAAPQLLALMEAIGGLWKLQALTALVGAVGVTGVAFAWLVAAADREVLGLPIGTLIRFAYPGTYGFYFCGFLPQTAFSLYAGNTGWQTPATLSAMGVLLAASHLLRVCYTVLLNSRQREQVIYDYYGARLDEAVLVEDGSLQKLDAVLQATALSAREQLLREYRFRGQETLELWRRGAAYAADLWEEVTDREQTLPDSFQDGREHPEITAVFLMENCWQTLLRDVESLSRRKLAIQEVLLELSRRDESAATAQRSAPETAPGNRTRSPAELAVLAGLVLAVADLHKGKDEPLRSAWEELDLLFSGAGAPANTHGLSPGLRRDLRIAFGMLLAVHFLWGAGVPTGVLRRVGQDLEAYETLLKEEEKIFLGDLEESPSTDAQNPAVPDDSRTPLRNMMKKSLSRALADSRDGNLELLLWYVEWAANLRRDPRYDALHYQIRVKAAFLPGSGGNVDSSPYPDGDLCYRALLLRWLADRLLQQ